jgi:hypothetical protein
VLNKIDMFWCCCCIWLIGVVDVSGHVPSLWFFIVSKFIEICKIKVKGSASLSVLVLVVDFRLSLYPSHSFCLTLYYLSRNSRCYLRMHFGIFWFLQPHVSCHVLNASRRIVKTVKRIWYRRRVIMSFGP